MGWTVLDKAHVSSHLGNSLEPVCAIRDGRVLGVSWQIVLMTVTSMVCVTPASQYHSAHHVIRAGWAQHVLISAMVHRYPWTVVYVFVMTTVLMDWPVRRHAVALESAPMKELVSATM